MRQLFSLKRKNTWNPAWSYAVDGLIWLFRINTVGRILGEVRHPVRKETTYFCLDEETGRVLWEGLRFDEAWWIGIEDLDRQRAYFHRYRKPDMPQHLGVIAVDLDSGTILWETGECSFLFRDDDVVYTAKQGFESMRYASLNASDGTLRRDFGNDANAINALRSALSDVDDFLGYVYPDAFNESHPEFSRFRDLIYGWCHPTHIHGTIDVLLHASRLLVSWHESEGPEGVQDSLVQRFVAYDTRSRSIVYTDTLNSGVAHPSIDSFFVKDERVIYVKDQHILTAHTFIDD